MAHRRKQVINVAAPVVSVSTQATANTKTTAAVVSSTTSVVPFIEYRDDGTYVVHDEAVEFLASLPAPISVATIVGPYRSGKSTLLNHCLLQKQVVTGGSTINACTKGILLVKELIMVPSQNGGPPMPMIVLDTEGLGSTDATNTHDVRIFSIALLLSSLFIYNSMGSIDENALSNLSLVANICKSLKLTSGADDDDSSSDVLDHAEQLGREAFPPLIWIVRDFALELKDPSGHPISPAQYLEQVLQAQPLSSAVTPEAASLLGEKNRLRRYIKACFPTRQCFTMVRPATDETELQALSRSTKVSSIRDLFVQQMLFVRSYVLKTIRPKQIGGGLTISGSGLVAYAKAIVDSINQGQHPVIHETWALISSAQVRDVFDAAKSEYAAAIKSLTNKALVTPSTAATATTELDAVGAAIVKKFKDHSSIKQHQHLAKDYLAQLEDFMSAERQAFTAVAAKMVQTEFTDLVASMNKYLTKNIIETDAPAVEIESVISKVSAYREQMIESFEKLVDGAPHELTVSLALKLHKQLQSWISKLSFAVGQHKAKAAAATEALAVLEASSQQQALNEQQQQLIDALRSENDSYQAKILSLETQLAEAQLLLAEERAAAADAKSAVDKMELDLAATKAQLDSATRAAQAESGRVSEDFDARLREAEYAAQTKYIQQLEHMRAEINAKMTHAQHEYESQVAEAAEAAEAAKMTAQQHEAVRQQMSVLVSELKSDLARLQESRLLEQLEWSKKLAESEKTAATAVVQKRHLEDLYDPTVVKRCKKLETDLSVLQVQLDFKNHEIQRLSLELSEAKASTTRWHDSFYEARLKHQEQLAYAMFKSDPKPASKVVGLQTATVDTDSDTFF